MADCPDPFFEARFDKMRSILDEEQRDEAPQG